MTLDPSECFRLKGFAKSKDGIQRLKMFGIHESHALGWPDWYKASDPLAGLLSARMVHSQATKQKF